MKIECYTPPAEDSILLETKVKFTYDDGTYSIRAFSIDINPLQNPYADNAPNEVMSEIMTLTHILLHEGNLEEFLRNEPHITCSRGKVKKSLKNRDSHSGMNRMARSVNLSFPKLNITVNNQEPSWFTEEAHGETNLMFHGLYLNTHIQTVTELGAIKFTAHAIERFSQYSHSEVDAFKSLRREMQPKLHPVRIPRRQWRHKCRKFGKEDAHRTEFWTNIDNPLVYVFVNDTHASKTLITCFRKLDSKR